MPSDATIEQTIERIQRNKLVLDEVNLAQARIFLERARSAKPDMWADPNPLVSIRIATYNRPKLLVERAIASVLRQTHQNFEIVVVGDHAAPETEAALQAIGDPRIRYFNLPIRPSYAEFPRYFWWTAGSWASAKTHELLLGDWVSCLDDDDEYPPHHIEVLLQAARKSRSELVYGVADFQNDDGSWVQWGNGTWACGLICSGAALYSAHLKVLLPDPFSWLLNEPADWNQWRRIAQAGANISFIREVVVRHYKEGSSLNVEDPRRLIEERPTLEQIHQAIIRTGADRFLLMN